MVLDDYGKKSDLPIHNFTPKKQNTFPPLYKKIVIGVTSIFILWYLFLSGGGEDRPVLQIPDELDKLKSSSHQLYKATKDGIVEIELKENSSAESESSAGGVKAEEKTPISEDELFKQTVSYYDLNDYRGTGDGLSQGDVVLFLMPLRNAESVLPMAFHNLMNLTYDHSLIDIAFLVSDCSPDDRTLETVFDYSVHLQNGTLVEKFQSEEELRKSKKFRGSSDLYQLYMDQDYINNVRKSYNNPESYHKDYSKPFRSVSIFRKDFGQMIGQGFSDRHAVKVQGIRRKLMGRARNWLTTNALKAEHSWVYWRDVDIETCPGTVIQDLMQHNYDVMVPNVWRPLPTFLGNEQPYDLNSWIESDPALELAKTLDEDDVIVEGYAEYPTWRVHLAYLRDARGNPNEVLDLDGVGGVSILAKAKIFRHGVHFPAFTFLNHAETEAFGKMAKEMGFTVGGLPHYTVWHIYEPSEDDLKEIAKMERKKRRKGGK